jgi:quinol monooxygenase YgiN
MALILALATGATAQQRPADNGALHDALRLNPTQEDAWRTYQAAIAPDPQAQQRHRAADMLLPQLTTPRRVALIEATAQADAADLHRQGEAVKAFYAGLTPDQQQTFDRLTADLAQARQSDGSGG